MYIPINPWGSYDPEDIPHLEVSDTGAKILKWVLAFLVFVSSDAGSDETETALSTPSASCSSRGRSGYPRCATDIDVSRVFPIFVL